MTALPLFELLSGCSIIILGVLKIRSNFAEHLQRIRGIATHLHAAIPNQGQVVYHFADGYRVSIRASQRQLPENIRRAEKLHRRMGTQCKGLATPAKAQPAHSFMIIRMEKQKSAALCSTRIRC